MERADLVIYGIGRLVMENARIANLFDRMADMLALTQANRFRIRSYRSAAQTIRGRTRSLADMIENDENVAGLPHIGESTAEKIREIIETGTCQRFEELKKKVPPHLPEIMEVSGLGPRKARALHKKLGVRSLNDLRQACERHRVSKLKGMGKKMEQNILQGLKVLEASSGRITLKEADDQVASLTRSLKRIKTIRHFEAVGSYRRGKETVGDLDIILQAKDRGQATKDILKHPEISEVLSRGNERVTVRLESGLQVDFRFFKRQEMGTALMYFTGSKPHNIALRRRAQDRKWKLSEYGLFSGKRRLSGESEKSVYRRLKLRWIAPELREDRGEIEAAEKDALPKLIELEDIRGNLHCHTNASDGSATIESMAKAAKERGLQYIAITDHSKAVRIANGLNESRLKRHAEKVRQCNGLVKALHLLAGVEVDILEDGKLDLKEAVLSDLDWVIASIHSHFRLSAKRMTERLLRAIRSGVVHCLGHPLGRMIGKREPMALDMDKIIEACREHDVALEINGQPERLDLPDTYCQHAREAGVKFAINTDAHSPSDFDLMRYGVTVARRGWVRKQDVLNTSMFKSLEHKIARN